MYSMDLQGKAVCLDSLLSAKAQNDKVLESCYDTPLCHTAYSSCHTDDSFCHTERSEVSKNKGVELQSNAVCLDFCFMLFWILRSLRSLKNDKENYRMIRNTPLRMTGKDTLKRQRNTLLSMTENKES